MPAPDLEQLRRQLGVQVELPHRRSRPVRPRVVSPPPRTLSDAPPPDAALAEVAEPEGEWDLLWSVLAVLGYILAGAVAVVCLIGVIYVLLGVVAAILYLAKIVLIGMLIVGILGALTGG